MDFAPEHFPDYKPGYTDYNTMRELLWKESAKITDFAIRKGLKFKQYNLAEFNQWEGFDYSNAFELDFNKVNSDKHKDVYIASAQIS
jgi:hypothetical protein